MNLFSSLELLPNLAEGMLTFKSLRDSIAFALIFTAVAYSKATIGDKIMTLENSNSPLLKYPTHVCMSSGMALTPLR